MAPEGIGIRRIGQIAIVVQDLDRARGFYRDVLELRHLFDAPPALAFFDCGGVRLMLSPPEGTEPQAGSLLYLDVADIERSHGLLAARGVEFVQPPHAVADLGDRVLWLAFFRDSEGNVVALMSEVAKAG